MNFSLRGNEFTTEISIIIKYMKSHVSIDRT